MLPEDSVYKYPYMAILPTILLPLICMASGFLTTLNKLLTSFDMNLIFPSPAKTLNERQDSKDRRKQFVLVTGCDRGFGHAIAKRLDQEGYHVIAGCLFNDSISALTKGSSDRMHAVKLDVTDRADLDNVYNWMASNMKGELRGVVNNAGVCFVGTPEIMAANDISKVINVNFIGTVNVTRKFLPLIRQSQGRVVNIGSVNGDVPMPFFSIYNSTKAAVKMFTESLAYEVKNWGVKVSLIAPAGFKTGIIMYDRTAQANKWWAEADEQIRSDYGKDFFNMPMRVSGRMKVSEDYSPVVESVFDALTEERPRAVYRIGTGSAALPILCKYLPQSLRSYVCGSLLNFISILPQRLRAD